VDLAGLMPGIGMRDAESPRVLVLNAGSSSLKASLVSAAGVSLWRDEIDWGADASRRSDRADALTSLIHGLTARSTPVPASIGAVGHRVVHGGSRFTGPVVIDDDVVEGLREVSDLAPLHNGVALETIEAARTRLPHIPHVACFDTAFHATLDGPARTYAIPERWTVEWGLRRYGFHGLSVEWATQRAASMLERAVADLHLVVAHLGSGCSVTAVSGGRSLATSMGMTPLEGLMMGTRSGSLDPGLLLRLLDRQLVSVDELGDALDHASGLLGVSGRSSDMRVLLEAESAGDARSQLAVAMFVERAAAQMAAAATSLPRLDAVVFSGGIGEHAAPIRQRIAARLAVVGVPPLPDPGPGGHGDGDVRLDGTGGPLAVLRIEAREDLVIAQHTRARLAH
jgi:acetate kinase